MSSTVVPTSHVFGRGPGDSGQLSFDEARSDGIRRADDHADIEWKHDAYDCIALCARRGRPFTADDVVELLEQCNSATHEPSALGPVFLRASRDRLIRKTGRMVPSRFARRHRDLTEWVAVDGW